MKTSLKQSIVESLNTRYLANFMEQFNSSMQDGALSQEERLNLEDLYREAIESAQADWDAVKDIIGQYENNDSVASGLAGQISQSITEDTASELVGLWNRTALDTRAIRDYTKDGIDHLVSIEANTYNTVLELRNAVTELRAINTNTKASGSRI